MRSADRHLDDCDLLGQAMTAATPGSHAETCPRCRSRVAALAAGSQHLRDLDGSREAVASAAPLRPPPFATLRRTSMAAEELVRAAEGGADELNGTLAEAAMDPGFPVIALHAAQLASRLPVRSPRLALAFVEAVRSVLPNHAGDTVVPLVLGELKLLESQALLYEGKTREASLAALEGVAALESHEAPLLLRSRGLYYAGSALWGEGRHEDALHRFEEARGGFAADGQDAWIGRVDAAIGLVHFSEARFREALRAFDGALERLDEEKDPGPVEAVQQNRAGILMNLGRLAEARAAFGQALELALRAGLTAGTTTIRVNLLGLGLEEGAFEEVRSRGEKLVATCVQEGLAVDAYYARLALAEAWAALGNYGAVRALVEVIRGDAPSEVRDDPDAMKLLDRLDAGDNEVAGRLRRLRRYLSGRDRFEAQQRA